VRSREASVWLYKERPCRNVNTLGSASRHLERDIQGAITYACAGGRHQNIQRRPCYDFTYDENSLSLEVVRVTVALSVLNSTCSVANGIER